jgi:F-type H+-transporting ATPase subunit epsilon
MYLEIITPDGKVFENTEVDQISITTEDGYITVLEDHTKLTTVVVPCELEVVMGDTTDFIAIGAGLLRVNKNKLVILVDTANTADTIDENTSEAARIRAEELLLNVDSIDAEELAMIQADLSRELARLNVIRKSKNRY